ncbi:MAG: ABC transporter substrate-binding protein [Desulfurococcales archaeon]|nr:ABC transporter substrate-binding protein [Desulfurococcales archaeon]
MSLGFGENKMTRRSIVVIILILAFLMVAGGYYWQSFKSPSPPTLEILRIGYLPIYPDAQFLVAYQLEWLNELKKLGVEEIKIVKFEQGVAMIQAFAAGELDVLYVGIDPVLVALEKGLPLRVVAANIMNPLALVGSKELARYYEEYGSTFLEKWREDKGRPVRIATLPKGTTPHALLSMFFEKLGYDPNNPPAEVLPMGIGAVRAALLNNEVDAAMIMEPVVTIALEKGYTIIVEGREVLPGHPGAVLAVSLDLIKKRPDIVEKLVELHIKATSMLNDDKEKAAKILSDAIGTEVLPVEIARKALNSPLSNFISNPHLIVNGTLEYQKFRVSYMGVKVTLKPSDIFETSFYDKLAGRGEKG